VAEGSSLWRVNLVLGSASLKESGALDVLEIGTPVKIVDMARHPAFGSEREGVSIFLMHRSKITHEPTNRFSPLPLS
jgi:hypothetical protein